MYEKKPITISINNVERKQITTANPDPTIKVQGKPLQAKEVDLVFVIDTTGSMSDKIEGLLQTCSRFVDEFTALNLNHQIAIVAFGDLMVPGDKISQTAFADKVEIIKRYLKNIPRYGGGGNEGESSLEALENAMGMPFRPNAVKMIILITDEPAHQYRLHTSDIIRKLAQNEFLVFVVAPDIAYYKEMANKCGGRWYQVSTNTDFTDLLELFRRIAEKVSKVVSDVYMLGNGSVSKYLSLKPPLDKNP